MFAYDHEYTQTVKYPPGGDDGAPRGGAVHTVLSGSQQRGRRYSFTTKWNTKFDGNNLNSHLWWLSIGLCVQEKNSYVDGNNIIYMPAEPRRRRERFDVIARTTKNALR